jgi:hypothetical protein
MAKEVCDGAPPPHPILWDVAWSSGLGDLLTATIWVKTVEARTAFEACAKVGIQIHQSLVVEPHMPHPWKLKQAPREANPTG